MPGSAAASRCGKRDLEVSRDEALAEVDRHEVEGGRDAFLAEVGDRPRYMGAEVLEWLGY